MSDRFDYFIRKSTGKTSLGEAVQTVYLGVQEGLTTLAPFIEDALIKKSENIQTTALHQEHIADAWHISDADLAVLVVPIQLIDTFAEFADIRAVARVHQVVDTACRQTFLSRLSKHQIRKRRRAERAGFSYDLSDQDNCFFDFYRNMYVPAMQNRHGTRARSVEEGEAFHTLFKAGALFRVWQKSEWIAGAVCQIDLDCRILHARLIGVKASAEQYPLSKAQNFAYHAVLDWAVQHPRIDKVDFQGSEPFLSKGTFQYKRCFGAMAIVPDNIFGQLRMLIRPKLKKSSVRCFLINNPLIADSPSGELVAHYFFDSNMSPRFDIPYRCPGLTQFQRINLDQL